MASGAKSKPSCGKKLFCDTNIITRPIAIPGIADGNNWSLIKGRTTETIATVAAAIAMEVFWERGPNFERRKVSKTAEVKSAVKESTNISMNVVVHWDFMLKISEWEPAGLYFCF